MILVVMGVSGSGKSTVGRELARQLGWPFHDGDDDHPAANLAKMHRGEPLTDADRGPWLEAIARVMNRAHDRGEDLVLACSALKHSYREQLRRQDGSVRFVFLTGPASLIAERLSRRRGHFMDPHLLESQIETLEPPHDAIQVDITPSPEAIAAEIRRRLGLDLGP